MLTASIRDAKRRPPSNVDEEGERTLAWHGMAQNGCNDAASLGRG